MDQRSREILDLQGRIGGRSEVDLDARIVLDAYR